MVSFFAALFSMLLGFTVWQQVPVLVQYVGLVTGGDDVLLLTPLSGVLAGLGLGMFLIGSSQRHDQPLNGTIVKALGFLAVAVFLVWYSLFDIRGFITSLLAYIPIHIISRSVQWVVAVWYGFWPGIILGASYFLAVPIIALQREQQSGRPCLARAWFMFGAALGLGFHLYLPAISITLPQRFIGGFVVLFLGGTLLRWTLRRQKLIDFPEINASDSQPKRPYFALVIITGLALGGMCCVWFRVAQLFLSTVSFGLWDMLLVMFGGLSLGLYLQGMVVRRGGVPRLLLVALPLLIVVSTIESYRQFIYVLSFLAEGGTLPVYSSYHALLQLTLLPMLLLGIYLGYLSIRLHALVANAGGWQDIALWGALGVFCGVGLFFSDGIIASFGAEAMGLFSAGLWSLVAYVLLLNSGSASVPNYSFTTLVCVCLLVLVITGHYYIAPLIAGVVFGGSYIMKRTGVPGYNLAFPAAFLVAVGLFVFGASRFPFGSLQATRKLLAKSAAVQTRFLAETSVPLDAGGNLPLSSVLTMQKFLQSPYTYRVKIEGKPVVSNDLAGEFKSRVPLLLHLLLGRSPASILQISPSRPATSWLLRQIDGAQFIDIVDTMPDGLAPVKESEGEVLGGPVVREHPLEARVYLAQSDAKYDMVSIEVPSIYLGRQVRYFSTEFFDQVAEHLTPHGMVSYQLPMSELSAEAFSSVLKGFCETFSDCSLWYVNDTTLIVMGGAYEAKTSEELAALWQTPAFVSSAPYGIAEQPAVLASHYVADGTILAKALADVTALSDDDWARDPRQRLERVPHQFLSYIDPDKSRERLQASEKMAEIFPAGVLRKAGYFFLYRPYIDDLLMSPAMEPQARFSFEPLSFLLVHTDLVALPRLLLHSDSRKLRVLSQKKRTVNQANDNKLGDKESAVMLAFEGIEALVQRDYRRAAALFTDAIAADDTYEFLYNYRIFALCMASKSTNLDAARKVKFAKALSVGMEVAQAALPPSNFNEEFWSWADSCST